MKKDIGRPNFLIFDGRYRMDPDRAIVMETTETLKEAKEAVRDHGDAVIVDSEIGNIIYDPEAHEPR